MSELSDSVEWRFWVSVVWLGEAKLGPTKSFASFLDPLSEADRVCCELSSSRAEEFVAATFCWASAVPAAKNERRTSAVSRIIAQLLCCTGRLRELGPHVKGTAA